MEIINTDIDDVKILQPRVFTDPRGYFMETWNYRTLKELGLDLQFVQDNESQSVKGTLRGIHFQHKHPQGKLVRVVRGEVFDIAVDLRKGAPTFGKWVGCLLSAEKKNALWIPEGFGHAYYTVSDVAIFTYKCTDYYYPDDQFSLQWNDPDIAVEWPITDIAEVILSEKDANGQSFKALTEIL